MDNVTTNEAAYIGKKYKFAVYMGRFQPFHDGHMNVLNEAFKIAEKVILLIGGQDKARQVKNPWTFFERMTMVSTSVDYDLSNNLIIGGIHDHPYSDADWAKEVRDVVKYNTEEGDTIALVGHQKDDSSYYLGLFPDWAYVEVGNYKNIDATTIRDIYFNHGHVNMVTCVPEGTAGIMTRFLGTSTYTHLVEEFKFLKNHKAEWSGTPFPNVFVTVDIAAICDDRILLIKRGGQPGKGLTALPGGYIDVNERIVDSARRELEEETTMHFSSGAFEQHCIANKVFDHPQRSQIGRGITHLFVLDLDDTSANLYATAADDAASLSWIPLYELEQRRALFSGDHYYMALYAKEQYYKNKVKEATICG
jgi:bifunctional NMN adenylyltransferase/nudix hydrolase